jgi:hypothetical protein
MKFSVFGACVIGLTTVVGGCSIQDKKTAPLVQQMPVNCATADDDLHMLEGEKKNTMQRIGSGVRLVVPVSLVGGVAVGTTSTKYQVATGTYNEMLDDKIAEIKRDCPEAAVSEAAAASEPTG